MASLDDIIAYLVNLRFEVDIDKLLKEFINCGLSRSF